MLRTRAAVVLIVLAAVAAALGDAGGAVPAEETVHAGGTPEAAELDPALRGALRRATAQAAREGIELVVDSGRRSPAHQARRLREAVAKY